MKQQVILHIGPPKTGTTSIQAFLSLAQADLLSQGVLYPAEGRLKAGISYCIHRPEGVIKMSGPADSHQLLAWSLMNEVDGINSNSRWLDVLDEINEAKPNRIILSGEAFSRLSKEIVQVREYLSGFNVQVVIFVRNHLDWMASHYTQSVKRGRYYSSFQSFIKQQNHRSLEVMIKKWAHVFGKERIVIKSFDKLKFVPGLEIDMIKMLELDPKCFKHHINAAKPRNVSPSTQTTHLIRLVNLIEHRLGSDGSRSLKKVFNGIRNKILAQDVCSKMLITMGRPLLSKPLYHNEDIVLLKNYLKDWYSSFLDTYVDREDHDYIKF